jgi:hypothetical protein
MHGLVERNSGCRELDPILCELLAVKRAVQALARAGLLGAGAGARARAPVASGAGDLERGGHRDPAGSREARPERTRRVAAALESRRRTWGIWPRTRRRPLSGPADVSTGEAPQPHAFSIRADNGMACQTSQEARS